MVTYISLMNFTDQGLRSVKQTTQRATAAARMAQEYGVTMKSIHWTQGEYDIICTLEAKDEQAIAAFGLAATSLGNFRAKSLRAFTAEEMNGIIARLP